MIRNFLFLIVVLTLTSFKYPAKEWHEYKLEGSNCSLLMPGAPTKQEKLINTAAGEITFTLFTFEPADSTDDNFIYGLAYVDFPADKLYPDSISWVKGCLDNARDGAISNVHGKFLSEIIIKYKQYSGREIRIDFQNGAAVLTARLYLIKNRLYTLQVLTLPDNDFNNSIKKFFDSFMTLE
ncbi:MAG: hypothetical protein P4L41_00100 [Flavipsychrobacter sp.]|nr:hypothetical protein [Flavipsychrobacter sp.]